jgi:hypothetical protein
MLVSGSSTSLSPALTGGVNLLRFSRVRDFPSWKVLIIALDIGPRVREAAGAYMAGDPGT